ncbi:ankyrin-1-like isoform X1 [Triticum dicoccoides]|uniref:ankyrin-1-like isoform X1 n=1 Tax=Triticum dicoccoides TaxID=85692 RepID=UPI000E7AD4AC|nr:ankyrin-1-like isoform X1 [Triticum dicoccoides]
MNGSGFDMRLGIESALRRALPYGGLPGNDSPQTAFFDAATEGDLRRLRELASGKDAEEKAWLADVSIQGVGPFQAAARLGKVDVCRCLVEELGFDINAGSKIGVTALAAAALDGKMDVVRYLLDNGADPNKKDDAGSVPLHCAAKFGHHEAARLLLSRGASVDIAYFHGTPLHIAAYYGKASVMKVLLEHHADPNKVSEVLGTPLIAALSATSEGLPESISLKCVKLLVEAGADVNSTNPDTALVVVTTYGLTDCMKYLLKAGADPNIPNSHCGAMPIQLAASCGRRKHVELLFPLTSPIRTISNWTVDGILANAKSKHSKPRDEEDDDNTKVQLKLCGEEAVKRKDYRAASMFYIEAIELDPTDATLYSNRSLCHMQMTEVDMALLDANTCIELRPEWLKGYYRKGVALMFLKEYKEACDVFMAGLKLDPGNAEMEKALREAVEAMKKDHFARKSFKPSD